MACVACVMPVSRGLRAARSCGFVHYRVSGLFRELAHMANPAGKPGWLDTSGRGRYPPAMKNGLYSLHMHMLDGVKGRDSGILILRDGRFLGGGPYFWSTGSYTCGAGTLSL